MQTLNTCGRLGWPLQSVRIFTVTDFTYNEILSGGGLLGLLHWVRVLCFGSVIGILPGLMPLPVGSPMKGTWFPTCARSWCFAGIKASIILGLTFPFGFLFDFCFGLFPLLVWATWSCQGGLAMTLWRLVGLSELVCRSAGVSRHSHSNNNNNNSNNSTDKVCKTPCGSMWRYVDVGDKIIREIHWFEVFAYKTPCGHICKGEKQNLHESAPFHHNSLVLVLDIGSDNFA